MIAPCPHSNRQSRGRWQVPEPGIGRDQPDCGCRRQPRCQPDCGIVEKNGRSGGCPASGSARAGPRVAPATPRLQRVGCRPRPPVRRSLPDPPHFSTIAAAASSRYLGARLPGGRRGGIKGWRQCAHIAATTAAVAACCGRRGGAPRRHPGEPPSHCPARPRWQRSAWRRRHRPRHHPPAAVSPCRRR